MDMELRCVGSGGVIADFSVGFRNHRSFLLFVVFLISGILFMDRLVVTCKPDALMSLTSSDVVENAPEYVETPSPGPTLCDLSTTLCRATFDIFLLSCTVWANIQLTWTSILLISHLWQISRQMTTFEVSNLGRYGFMGGRGGSSLRNQSGAMRQAPAIGAGIGPSGAGEEATGDDAAASGAIFGPDGNAILPRHSHRHSHPTNGLGRCWKMTCNAVSGPLMQILGLDRFTKGKAMSGMARAGRGQNPFDLGIVQVSDTWSSVQD